MVLGYFGKTPVKPDSEIVKIASEKLNLEPTTKTALELANADETKSLKYWEDKLKAENIQTTEENIFIAAACGEKGIIF
jgi:pyruvate carboxylase subunit B